MNNNPNTPRYYRLLEKGETIKEGDTTASSFPKPISVELVGEKLREFDNSILFRPVTVDEWIPYAERKPTREDFEPTGAIEAILKDNSSARFTTDSLDRPVNYAWNWIVNWRKISPPQPAKPKSVECRLWNTSNFDITTGLFDGKLTLNADGTANLGCGDVIAANCLDEIFKARNSVMDKHL